MWLPFAGNEDSSATQTYSQQLLDQISSNDPSLKSISLQSKGLNDQNIKRICEALIRSRVVEEVYLSYNRISDVGAASIGHMLKFNRCVREICLAGNEIGPKGAAALASALAANKTLQSLNLQNNQIGIEGAGALVASLYTNRTITSLSIKNNAIPTNHSITFMLDKMLKSNEQYPEHQSLVVGLGEGLKVLIDTMESDLAEGLVLQAEDALKKAMVCRRRGDVVGAAEAEGIFIRICTKGQAPLDPPEGNENEDALIDKENMEDPPEANNPTKFRMPSRRQSEPDRLDELNDELKTLKFNNSKDEQGDETFVQFNEDDLPELNPENKEVVDADPPGENENGLVNRKTTEDPPEANIIPPTKLKPQSQSEQDQSNEMNSELKTMDDKKDQQGNKTHEQINNKATGDAVPEENAEVKEAVDVLQSSEAEDNTEWIGNVYASD